MCGLTGFINFQGLSKQQVESTLKAMNSHLINRGPDDEGYWFDFNTQVALAHRRLSIIDLSKQGKQPMQSPTGHYILVFNGEIYNHQTLRESLSNEWAHAKSPLVWRGHSDTETLLACIEHWGLQKTLTQAVGMFAIALWDRTHRTLYLARDRVGEKPLYYAYQNGVLMFGSTLSALKTHGAFTKKINPEAIAMQLQYHYIQAPHTIYQKTHQVMPGTIITIKQAALKGNTLTPQALHTQPYWSFDSVVESGLKKPFKGNDNQAIKALDKQLRQAVKQQIIADVPLGCFLSGGIDSSSVASLMQAQSSTPIKTFSIGFDDPRYNEAKVAKKIAKHLGTEHHELYVSEKMAQAVIPHLPTMYDEPFSDSSQIPTFLVSKMAKQQVSVALSGDGGDELFGGYKRYRYTHNLWRYINKMPRALKNILCLFIQIIPAHHWNLVYRLLHPIVPQKYHQTNLAHILNKLVNVLSTKDQNALYHYFISHWSKKDQLLIRGELGFDYQNTPTPFFNYFDDYMMATDTLNYLPGCILTKVDRVSMANSLETRMPFIDHHVLELAWQLPLHMKIRAGQGKWILRQVLQQYLPPTLTNQPKKGFSMPVGDWLRGSLREWADDLLNESSIKQAGFFHHPVIQKTWTEHLSGNRQWPHHLWAVLMFQAWLKKERETPTTCKTPN